MRVIPFPPALLGEPNAPRCFHDGHSEHKPSAAYALVVVGGGEVRAVCERCMWRYCHYCNLDAHRCPHCGTVADHFEQVCPEGIAELAAEAGITLNKATP